MLEKMQNIEASWPYLTSDVERWKASYQNGVSIKMEKLYVPNLN